MTETRAKTVVISGASSGIGRATALLLVGHGFRVFAGVRKPADGEWLRAEGGSALEPIVLDVTDAASISAAAASVSERTSGHGLDGLVNNAGIGIPAPVEYVSGEELRRQFEVNVFGLVATTQAFLPLVRRARGRVVNMGSVGDHITMPFGGALCGSKCAVKALNDALRLELSAFGIRVCLIEPGAIRTPAVDKTLGDIEGVIRALPPEGAERYGDMLRAFAKRAYANESAGSPPEVVARAVYHALTARRPHLRYPVGANVRRLMALPRLVPERALDLLRLRIFGIPAAFGSKPAA